MQITPYTPGMTITPPCLISNMPNEVYHSMPGISKTGLDLIDRSPAHFRYREPREPTRAMAIGTAIHTALLEPQRFATEYLLLRDITDRRSSVYKEAIKHRDPELVLTGTEADRVAGMQESVYSQPKARAYLEAVGHRELSAFAKDPETGVLCRARFDLLTDDGRVLDIKKTQDARPIPFGRSVANYRYYVQDAFYSDVFEWATGQRLESFKFLAVEEKMPHAALIYELDDEAKAHGRKCYRENLNLYAQCVEADEWPGYVQEFEHLSLPSWMMAEIEMENDENFTTGDEE